MPGGFRHERHRIVARVGDAARIDGDDRRGAAFEGLAALLDLIQREHRGDIELHALMGQVLDQVRESCKALKGGAPSIVSVFAGRIADAGYDPMPLMTEAARHCAETDARIELLWASSREVLNLAQAESCGVGIITMTPALIGKIGNFRKDLGQFSLETVQMFKRDADAAGYQL